MARFSLGSLDFRYMAKEFGKVNRRPVNIETAHAASIEIDQSQGPLPFSYADANPVHAKRRTRQCHKLVVCLQNNWLVCVRLRG